MLDFTVQKYACILQAIKNHKHPVYTVLRWIEEKPEHGIVLRHDVDRKPANALRIAELEKEYDIQSTYYFRTKKCSFQPEIIKKIHDLGHEIGYHYEDLSDAKGNHAKAIVSFTDNLKKMREIVPVTTIAMHGSPLSKIDNRTLWNHYDYTAYNLKGEAFLTIDYSNMYYLTDTGRTWHYNGANIRDSVTTEQKAEVYNSDSLIDFMGRIHNLSCAIVMHPERWGNNKFDYLITLTKDNLINMIKKIVLLPKNTPIRTSNA